MSAGLGLSAAVPGTYPVAMRRFHGGMWLRFLVWGKEMVATGALAALGAEVGMVLAKKIGAALTARPKADDRLKRVDAMLATGSTAVVAFQRAFGSEFYEAVSSALGGPRSTWTHEAGRADYIRVDVDERRTKSDRLILRDELNINLDRIAQLYGNKGVEVQGYFLGVFREWMSRYRERFGKDPDAEKTFKAIESLLDGRRRTFADAFKMLQQTGLGVVGALLVLQAVLVATSTGVGIVAAISTWLFGIPVVQVGVLVVSGALLFALSRVRFSVTSGMSTAVAAAYKLLDRGESIGVRGVAGGESET